MNLFLELKTTWRKKNEEIGKRKKKKKKTRGKINTTISVRRFVWLWAVFKRRLNKKKESKTTTIAIKLVVLVVVISARGRPHCTLREK